MSTPRLAAVALAAGLAFPAAASADRFVPPASPAGPTFLAVGAEFVSFAGYAYFAANDGIHGNELWRTDGTPAGTTLFGDLGYDPGSGASSHSNPRSFRIVGNRLFFQASTSGSGQEIYVIDQGASAPVLTSAAGSPAPTTGGPTLGSVGNKALLYHYDGGNYKLYAVAPGSSAGQLVSNPVNGVDGEQTAELGGYAYFSQNTGGSGGSEVWRTDGTSAAKFAEIHPSLSSGSSPRDFISTSNRVFFTADDGTHGRELYSSDGTSTPTIVHEHGPLNIGVSIGPHAVNGNVLYYVPNDPVTGAEVWRTDGTPGGTRVVKDITPGIAGHGQITLIKYGSGFAMLRGSDVWVSDGTEAGTKLLTSVDPDGYGPVFPVEVGSKFYFRGGFTPNGSVLWRSDGTAAGTQALTSGPFDGLLPSRGTPDIGPVADIGNKLVYTGRYPHEVGDPLPDNARRVFAVDTTQADETRVASAAPAITGTPAVGQKLTVTKGSWSLDGQNRYAYQWLRNGTQIPNVFGTEYTPGTQDAGAQIVVRVTASGLGFQNFVDADSAAVTIGGAVATPQPGANATPKPIATPKPGTGSTLPAITVKKKLKLTGSVKVGKKLTVTPPTFNQKGVKLTYSWSANGVKITGATKSTLTLKSAQKGKKITVTVKANKSGYKTLTLKATTVATVKAR